MLSISATDKDSALAFLKTIVTIVTAYDDKLNKPLISQLSGWAKQAESFIQQFGLGLPNYKAIIQMIVQEDYDNPRLHERIVKLADTMKAKRAKYEKELDLTKDQIRIMNAFRIWIKTESESSHKSLNALVSQLGEPLLNKRFVVEQEDHAEKQADTEKQLKAVVKRLTGKPGTTLSKEEAAKYRDKPLYKEYLKLARQMNAPYKEFVHQMVRSSGKQYLPYRDVIIALEQQGIRHKLPTGFIGNIGEKCELYTTAGLKLKGYPGSATEVFMNPEYVAEQDNAYVFKARPLPDSKIQRYYTVEYDKSSSVEKFQVVEALAEEVAAMRSKWRQDLGVRNKYRLQALLCELAYITQGRIGNVNAKTKGSQTYGLSTLKVKQVKLTTNLIDIKYPAKKGVPVHFKVNPTTPALKKVHAILQDLMKDKGPNDYILVSPKGKLLTSNTMKSYLKSIGAPEGTTIHKFRHLRGTELAKEILEASPFKGKTHKDKEVNDWFMKAMTKVGEELGHVSGDKVTPNTAIQNYISAGVMVQFFKKLNVRPNSTIQRAIDRATKEESKS